MYIYTFHLNTQTVYLCKFENTFSTKIQNRKRYLHIRDTRQLYRKVLFVEKLKWRVRFVRFSELFMNGNWVEKVVSPLWTALNVIYHMLSFLSEIILKYQNNK